MADLSAVLDVLRQRHESDLQAWGCAALRNLTEEGGDDFRQRALEAGSLEHLGQRNHGKAMWGTRLVLHESLQQQGLGGQRAQVSATYMPVNLHAAWRFAHGHSVEDEEFSLNGVTEVTNVSDQMFALLHKLPKSLRTLTFAPGFNQENHRMRLPEGLQHLTFGSMFNHSLDKVTWPSRLQSLTFGNYFDQNLDKVTWPAGLQSLTFGVCFNQSLDKVMWPAGLQGLTLGAHFNRSLDNLTWPAGLQSLTFDTFGGLFNQNLDNVIWPAGLQSLTFGRNFNQSLDKVIWPAGLQSLTFGRNFNQSLGSVIWPVGLQGLTFGQNFDQSLDKVTWPAGLQSLTFVNGNLQSLQDVDVLPRSLAHLAIGEMLVILALEKHAAAVQVQECGLAALSGFAKAAGEAHGPKALQLSLKALKEHLVEEEVCRWAFSALSEVLRCENMAEELGKYSFLDLVCFAMQRHSAAAQVQACAAAFLGRLALKSDMATVKALTKATQHILLKAMEVHSSAVEVAACSSSALGAFVLRGAPEVSMVPWSTIYSS
eukprot:symbB.v1.2.011657.t2/scaffold780.1/size163283/1